MRVNDDPFDFIIIGGGIIGSSIAFHLSKYDKRILLLDANHDGKATDAGAGIIAGATTFSEEEEMYKLVSQASQYYPDFIDLLMKKTDLPTGYRVTNELIPFRDDGDSERFEVIVERILERQKRYNYPNDGELEVIGKGQILKDYPNLTNYTKALKFSGAAQVDGKYLNKALLDASAKEGVTVKNEEVIRLIIEDITCKGVETKEAEYIAKKVIIAGGAWSAMFEKQLSVNFNILPQRGQIVHLEIDENVIGKLPIIISQSDHYLLQWSPNTVVIGATRESDSGFNSNTTVDGIIQVLQAGLDMVPKLANAKLKEVRVGLRPYSMDKIPIIGPVPNHEEVWVVTGHGPLGLTAAPFTGKIVAEVLNNHKTHNLSMFDPRRFA